MADYSNAIRWDSRALEAEVSHKAAINLLRIGEEVRAAVVAEISEESPPASEPYEPPHADTGKLRQSYFAKMDGDDAVIVGSPLPYSLNLELGTSKMAPRPHLYNALYGVLKKYGLKIISSSRRAK